MQWRWKDEEIDLFYSKFKLVDVPKKYLRVHLEIGQVWVIKCTWQGGNILMGSTAVVGAARKYCEMQDRLAQAGHQLGVCTRKLWTEALPATISTQHVTALVH